MKRKYKFDNIISETLLIPLYMRAKESKRGKEAILKDEWAVKLVNQTDYDYSQIKHAKLSELGCLVRSWYFDHIIRHFIKIHPDAVIVNVGCGLDARVQRLGPMGKAVFYSLDLPEVMKIRKKMIPEAENEHYLTASLLESGWMDDLKHIYPENPFLFVAEGVLMFFYESQVRLFIDEVSKRFSGGELWFDVCGPMMSRGRVKPDSLRHHQAEIRCGISNGHMIEKWNPQLELIEQACYMNFFRDRWGFIFGTVLRRFPKLCFLFSSLLGYRIKA